MGGISSPIFKSRINPPHLFIAFIKKRALVDWNLLKNLFMVFFGFVMKIKTGGLTNKSIDPNQPTILAIEQWSVTITLTALLENQFINWLIVSLLNRSKKRKQCNVKTHYTQFLSILSVV